jgi:flagellar motility protein MotE (MotC chaperone)
MRFSAIIAPAFLLTMAASMAQAQDAERYTLEKSGQGFVRMDRTTGEMSICEERSGQLVCKLAADERSAFQDEIDRLEGSVKALDERVAKLESGLSAKLDQALPTDEQIDRTVDTMQRFLRGFMGIVKELENEADSVAPQPGEQKT